MMNVDTIEDFRTNLSVPVDLETLCGGGESEFEVCMPEEPPENDFFDSEDIFKQLNLEANYQNDDEGGDEDLTPFERIASRMTSICTGNGVMKKVLKQGSGEVIAQGYIATVHYNGYFEYNDEPYDSTRLRNRPERIRLGQGQTIEGLELAIGTMRKGELAQFLVKPEYAFGAIGVPPRIPQSATILFEIELLSISENSTAPDFESWTAERKKNATFPETLEVANAARKAGNELYRDKHISKASYQYVKAIRLLEDIRLADQAEEDDMQHVLLKLYLNMSLCCIQLYQSTRALTYCTKALDLDKHNIKATFRRGQALLQISEFDRAHSWLSKAQKQSPNDVAIMKELAKLNVARNKFKQLEQSMCSKMFRTSGTAKKDGTKPQRREKTCPSDVQELIKGRLKAFQDDEALVEMPFPLDTLTSSEVEFMQQAALDMGLEVRKLKQNSDQYLKIYKPQLQANE